LESAHDIEAIEEDQVIQEAEGLKNTAEKRKHENIQIGRYLRRKTDDRFIKTSVIAILAIILTGIVHTFLTGGPYGLLFKAPWIFISVQLLSKKNSGVHILWLFGVPFLLGYIQFLGSLGDHKVPLDIAAQQYFIDPTFVKLHIYNLILYVTIWVVGSRLEFKRKENFLYR
jgi:hypothetical protein